MGIFRPGEIRMSCRRQNPNGAKVRSATLMGREQRVELWSRSYGLRVQLCSPYPPDADCKGRLPSLAKVKGGDHPNAIDRRYSRIIHNLRLMMALRNQI